MEQAWQDHFVKSEETLLNLKWPSVNGGYVTHFFFLRNVWYGTCLTTQDLIYPD